MRLACIAALWGLGIFLASVLVVLGCLIVGPAARFIPVDAVMGIASVALVFVWGGAALAFIGGALMLLLDRR